jgi:hypothetical protein
MALHAIARQADYVADSIRLRLMTRISGVDDPIPADALAEFLKLDYLQFIYRWIRNPQLAVAWSITSINDAEYGVERLD